MNQMPFPKPPPAKCEPLEDWLDQTDRAEVGREPFFRGRDEEYDVFRRAVNSLRSGHVGGGTMVFQGAPGAGKSALMGECMEAVRRHSTPEDPWVAVAIQPESLESPLDTVMQLVEGVNVESERLSKGSPGSMSTLFKNLQKMGKKIFHELSKRGGGVMTISVGGSPESERSRETNMTSSRVFLEAAPLLRNFHLMVLVDEAQDIPANRITRGVVRCLHDPPGKIPLLTAFFGLSDTRQVLSRCGLSRFPRGRLVNLEPMPLEDATCSIRSVFETYGFTGTLEDRESWVERLAGLSQGWPQHVNSVSIAASSVIRDNGGKIDAERLVEAVTLAEEYKDEYYEGRLAAGSSWDWVYRMLALGAQKKDGVLSWDDIDILTESARARRNETTDEFLYNALHAGLLAPVPKSRDHFGIPIPSLGDFLRALPAEPPSWA